MDRLIYLAMTGAKHMLARQDTLANNLANANTTGFRAENVAFRSVPVQGIGSPTRAFVVDSTPTSDFTPGPIQHTGRNLDIAVNGRGWIAVQTPDGSEAYTRAGSLQLDPEGMLQTAEGLPVLGDGGPILIPQDNRVTIAADGTVTAVPAQPPLRAATPVGQIKLVNPPEETLRRGADGLFRTVDGTPADLDPEVRLTDGAVEGSNVNVADAMIGIIAVARQFELQMKVLQSADTNDQSASRLLSVSA